MTTTAEISIFNAVPDRYDLTPLWTMYHETFEPLAELAVQRHVMWWEEFVALIQDPHVTKIVATDPHGSAGLALLTNDLSAVPLVSPQYFDRRWPKLVADSRVWYVPFVCVRQDPKAVPGVFETLVSELSRPVAEANGVAVMDYCDHNRRRRLPEVSFRIMNRVHGRGTVTRIDSQSYWVYDLTAEDA
jgi:hypothetical protein